MKHLVPYKSPLFVMVIPERIEPTMLLFAALLLRVEQHLKGSASQQVKGWSFHPCFPIQIHLCLELSTNDEIILLSSHPTDSAKITFHSFLQEAYSMQNQERYFCEGVRNAWHNLQPLFSLTVVRGKVARRAGKPFSWSFTCLGALVSRSVFLLIPETSK